MCFVWIWEQTAIISLYSINWLVLITETECVYCPVRTQFSHEAYFIPNPIFIQEEVTGNTVQHEQRDRAGLFRQQGFWSVFRRYSVSISSGDLVLKEYCRGSISSQSGPFLFWPSGYSAFMSVISWPSHLLHSHSDGEEWKTGWTSVECWWNDTEGKGRK